MSDVVQGDPVTLLRYTDVALATVLPVGEALVAARHASNAYRVSPSDRPLLELHDPDVRLGPVLRAFAVVDRVPAAVAAALLEVDGSDLAFGPAPTVLRVDDDEVFDQLADGYVGWLWETGADGFQLSDALLLALAGAGGVASREGPRLDGLVAAHRRRAGGAGRAPAPGAWQRVGYGLAAPGLIDTAWSEYHDIAADELATQGQRVVGTGFALFFEGGGSLLGGGIGAFGGQFTIPVPYVGAVIGGAAGSEAGGRAGREFRHSERVSAAEERLAGWYDQVAGTGRDDGRARELRARSRAHE